MTANEMLERTKVQTKRYAFIDHYRGWAVLVMMETHSTNAWLADQYRNTSWFPYLKFINGFVAPSFLFLAGVAFVIVARKREFQFSLSEFFRLLRRFALIWIIGYLLHLPEIKFQNDHFVFSNLNEFYKVDVLQTIAVGLIVLLLLTLFLQARMIVATIALTAAAVFIAPILWSHDFSTQLHPFVANYLNGKNNPLFPLFPWVAFLWGGAVTAFYFFKKHAQQESVQAAWKIATFGALLFVVGYFGRFWNALSYTNFWLDSPQWMLMRSGIVLLIFAFFFGMEQWEIRGKPWMHVLGTESLFAYVAHLLIIFSFTGPLAKFPLTEERQFNPLQTFLMFVLLAAVVTCLTWLWKKRKTWHSPQRS